LDFTPYEWTSFFDPETQFIVALLSGFFVGSSFLSMDLFPGNQGAFPNFLRSPKDVAVFFRAFWSAVEKSNEVVLAEFLDFLFPALVSCFLFFS